MENRPKKPTEGEKLKALPWNLAHGTLTSIFYLWTWGGSVFLLFLSELNLPKGQIGTLLSLFPFAGLVALFFAPIATRLGWKRVFIFCYGCRYITMSALLLIPLILIRAGHTTAVIFLFGVMIVFALLRALAETAYYPWSQEYIPNSVRGKFTAYSTVLSTIGSGAALLVAGYVIGSGTGLGRFQMLLAAGCVVGFIGILLMIKVPGGDPMPASETDGPHFANMTKALRDPNFIAYLGGLAGITIGTTLITSFLPLYVKEQIGISSGIVVLLDTAIMLGGALSSLVWGWAADRVGSRPVLMPALFLSLLIPIGWLLLPRNVPNPVFWCTALYFVYGVASAGVGIGAGRLLFNGVIPQEKSTAYTALYYTWMGLTGGAAPLMAGSILSLLTGWQAQISFFAVDGNMLLFILGCLLIGLGWWQYGRVKPDDIYSTRSAFVYLFSRIQDRRSTWQNYRGK
jgi:MFS family permease